MELAGRGSRGYAMAALLVAMSVMAVLMGALLPVWTHMATREKEAELVFRGNQYARAIGLFQRKFANTPPPTIDVLVEQRFLRKKYKDPITNDDFQPIYANQALTQGVSAPTGAQRPGEQASSRLGTPAKPTPFGSTGVGAQGGIIGVTSKSKETSIKILNGRNKYNEWAFVYIQTAQRPGQGGPGGQPGLPPGVQQPGSRPGLPPGMQPGLPPGNQPGMGGRQLQGGFGFSGGPGQAMPPPPPGQPNRPPPPGGFPNPGTIQAPGTTFTPIFPGQRPGQRPPGQ